MVLSPRELKERERILNSYDPATYDFKIGDYVKVTEEGHFLEGKRGKIVKKSVAADAFTSSYGEKFKNFAVDFDKYHRGPHMGRYAYTTNLIGSLPRNTGCFMMGHQIRKI